GRDGDDDYIAACRPRMKLDRDSMTAQYPPATALEERLRLLALEIGDQTDKPFRVDLVRVHGGKPPVYCVVIRSSPKEPLRRQLEQLLNRRLTCGVTSFMLKADEVMRIMGDAQHYPAAGRKATSWCVDRRLPMRRAR